MLWRVEIPPPSAKRLTVRQLVIDQWSGWETYPPTRVVLSPGQDSYEFEVEDDTDWVGDTSVNDGDVFSVVVLSSNVSGSRADQQELTPVRMLRTAAEEAELAELQRASDAFNRRYVAFTKADGYMAMVERSAIRLVTLVPGTYDYIASYDVVLADGDTHRYRIDYHTIKYSAGTYGDPWAVALLETVAPLQRAWEANLDRSPSCSRD